MIAALAYDLMVNTLLAPERDNFAVLLWHCKIPWKIKCFIWLLINNKILTWDNLSKRGWIGPSRCGLCGSGDDSIQHIFVECNSLYQFFPGFVISTIVNHLCVGVH